MPIPDIFLHIFYIVASYLGETLCHGPHPSRPLAEVRERFKEKICFLEITMFLGQKIDVPFDQLSGHSLLLGDKALR